MDESSKDRNSDAPSDTNGDGRPSQENQSTDNRELGAALSLLTEELRAQREERRALRETPGTETGVPVQTHEESAPAGQGGRVRRFFSRRPWRILLAALGVILIVLGSLYYIGLSRGHAATDDAQVSGNIDPISSRVSGMIIRVFVENTDQVKKGDPLVYLDPRDYKAAAEQAQGHLAEAQAALNAAKQNYKVARANLAQARATNAKAQHDAARYAALLHRRVVPQQTYERYWSVAQVDAAAVKAREADVGAAQKAIAEKAAAVQAAEAALDQAQLNLGYTKIAAPAAGEVGEKTAEVGERVQPGQQLLAIIPLNDVWVTADFRETQLKGMYRGEPATIHVDATRRNYRGYVEGLPAASGDKFSLLPPNNATGNYVKVVQRLPVRIGFEPGQDRRHRLRLGMSAEVTVDLKKK